MKVGYLINMYPAVSHSFIRREILALETRGVTIFRYAIRSSVSELIDPEDIMENSKTHHFIGHPVSGLLAMCAQTILRYPVGILRALSSVLAISRRSDRGFGRHLAYLAEATVIAKWCRRDQIAHLHAHFGTNSATVALLVHRITGLPYSFTVHGPEEFDKPQSIALPEKIRAAAFVIAVSSYGRSQLMRWTDVDQWSKIHVVHCGIDFSPSVEPPLEVAPVATLVCVARLVEQKGLFLLLEAVTKLRESGIHFNLVLAGDGPMRPKLEQRLSESGLDNVRITGWICGARVKEEIMLARAMVLPSFAEGLPVVLMEAMALGKPVISTYVAGIPELVVPGLTGWLVPAGDPTSLADAIRHALGAGPAELTRLGVAARERVSERHDISREARKLEMLMLSSVSESQRTCQ
jgi:glycosyltransferase involved in cell wall biosynthesis